MDEDADRAVRDAIRILDAARQTLWELSETLLEMLNDKSGLGKWRDVEQDTSLYDDSVPYRDGERGHRRRDG